MRYLALLRDSLVETLDRKSFYVVLVVAVLLIFLCASIGFRELDAAGSLQLVAQNFGNVHRGTHGREARFPVKYEVKDVVTEGKSYKFLLEASPVDEFHRSVLTWNALQKGLLKDAADPVEGISGKTVADPGFEVEEKFLRFQYRANMIPRVEIEAQPGTSGVRAFRVTAQNPRSLALEGGHEATFFFGAFSARLPFSLAVVLIFLEVVVADWIGGLFGVILAVIFTAGFVPGMLQKGTLDLVLAKPVRRPFVILTKYLGGLFYVAIPATLLIGGCWLAISWRSGYFNFGFLTAIGALVAIFAVLYSFAVLMGVLTRSTIATILLTIGLWFFSFALTQTHVLFEHSGEFGFTAPRGLAKTVEKARLVFPRTTELSQVSNYYILMGNLGPEIEALLEVRGQDRMSKPQWFSLGLSSIGFIVAMLGLSCWTFSRRDY